MTVTGTVNADVRSVPDPDPVPPLHASQTNSPGPNAEQGSYSAQWLNRAGQTQPTERVMMNPTAARDRARTIPKAYEHGIASDGKIEKRTAWVRWEMVTETVLGMDQGERKRGPIEWEWISPRGV